MMVDIMWWGVLALSLVTLGWLGWGEFQTYREAHKKFPEAGQVVTENLEHKDAD